MTPRPRVSSPLGDSATITILPPPGPVLAERFAVFRVTVRQSEGAAPAAPLPLPVSLSFRQGTAVQTFDLGAGDAGAWPPFDHMVLRVRLDEDWLVDVGFGDSFVEPLRLAVDRVQPQAGWDYRITRAGNALALQRRRSDSDWASTYAFDLQAHALSEYQDTCRYHETSPESHFTQGDVCTLLTATGRITLSGNRWIESTGNERHERGVGPTETAQLLADRFGIRVDSET